MATRVGDCCGLDYHYENGLRLGRSAAVSLYSFPCADDSIAMTKEDPVVGLPLGSQWVEELEKRLKANSLNPSKRHLDHM